jgi:hypothetical protein
MQHRSVYWLRQSTRLALEDTDKDKQVLLARMRDLLEAERLLDRTWIECEKTVRAFKGDERLVGVVRGVSVGAGLDEVGEVGKRVLGIVGKEIGFVCE